MIHFKKFIRNYKKKVYIPALHCKEEEEEKRLFIILKN